jgi:NitT/TauT family transport system permease protein
MGVGVADPPEAAVVPAEGTSRRGGAARATGVVLSPAIAAGAVLAVHYLVPDSRQLSLEVESLNLPAWRHPFPVVLLGVLVLSLFLAAVQSVWRLPRRWVRHTAPLAAALTGLTGVWDLVTLKYDLVSQTFFPGPDEVFGAIARDRAILLESAWHSLRLLFCGYLLGVTAGVATGVLIGWFPRVRYWGMPALKLVGPIPATALIPLVMTLWKDSFPGSVALIGFAVWFPVTILTSSGIANVRLSYLDVARTLGAGRFYLIFRVAIPAALPNIFVGLFMGLGASFLTLAVAEAVGVQAGLGWYLNWRQGSMEYAAVYGALIISAAFFSTLMTLLFKIRDRVLRWQHGVIKW